MSEASTATQNVETTGQGAASSLVLVCEHASAAIPQHLNDLGLSAAARHSHIAWDPGALPVAQHMAKALDAVLIASTVSRLVFDCNRPPEAPDAMPAQNDGFDVPGNADISAQDRQHRAASYYVPFHAQVARQMAAPSAAVLVTVHSFTPVYQGRARAVEIGVLHDADARLADALLDTASAHTDLRVVRNQPYGPQDGVTHTLKTHALAQGHLNVMIEVRNDLIATPQAQRAVAGMLSAWLQDALARLGVRQEGRPCKA